MEINLSEPDLARLSALATASGYDSAEAYAAERLAAIAHGRDAEHLAPPNDDALNASLAMCDRGMAEIDAGGGHDAQDALRKIGRERGFRVDG